MSIAWNESEIADIGKLTVDDRKVSQACSIGGQVPASFQRLFLELPRYEDRQLVADFIIDSYHEKNIAVKTKCTYISNLVYLSRYLSHKKSFKDMTAILRQALKFHRALDSSFST